MISLVLADDHVVVRQGIKSLLESYPDFKVVGEANDGLEAIQVTERMQPNILMLDLSMDKIDGIEVVRQLKNRSPKTAVVIVSMHADETHVVEALQAGARAYVVKGSDVDELVRAVREAAFGRHYLSSILSEQAIQSYIRTRSVAASGTYNKLTSREREVIHLAASGYTSAAIARQLYLSRRTVEVHRARAMRKLGIKTLAGLIRYALGEGMLNSDSGVASAMAIPAALESATEESRAAAASLMRSLQSQQINALMAGSGGAASAAMPATQPPEREPRSRARKEERVLSPAMGKPARAA